MSPAAYRVYVTALIAVMTVLPFTWGAIDSVADPTVVRAIVDAAPSRSIAIGVGGLLGAAALLGALRGPVVGKPFEMSVRVASPKPRATSFRPAFLRNACAAILFILYGTGILLAGVWRGGGASGGRAGFLAIGALACAVLIALAWLAGQVLQKDAWALAAGAVVLGVIIRPSPVLIFALLVFAIAGVVTLPRLLNTLAGPAVVAQSQRWHAAWNSFYIGDAAGAFSVYEAVPRRGRYWSAFAGGSIWWRTFRADLISAARMPGRMFASLAGLVVGAGGVLAATAISGAWSFAAGAVGAMVLYLALGLVTTRFKFVADLHRSPALFRFSTSKMYALHAAFPALFAAVGSALAAVSLIAGFPELGTAPLILPCTVVLVLALRGFNSAKGHLPAALLAPVDSPVGDFSSLNVVVWQADALLLAGLAGAVLANIEGAAVQGVSALLLTLGALGLWHRRLT